MKHKQQPSKDSGATMTTNANTNEEDVSCITRHTIPHLLVIQKHIGLGLELEEEEACEPKWK